MPMNFEQFVVESEARKVAEFDKWLDRPEIQMLISLLPPLTNDMQHDAFNALLKSVFNTGHDVGISSVAVKMIQAMTEAKTREG